MTIEWPEPWAPWLTPHIALHNWRERIERVAAQETAKLAELPYVKAVAVVGTVGRGTHWPLSDIDIMLIADRWEGRRPHELVQAFEDERNRELHTARIPNTIEARLWSILPDYVRKAVGGNEECFVSVFDRWPMLGIPMKAQGGRVAVDCDGLLGRFIERCNSLVFADRFRSTWLRVVVDDAGEHLARAASLIGEAEWTRASIEILRAAQAMTAGMYAMWRRVPESLARCVTGLLDTARDAGDEEMGSCFLAAACLGEDDTWRRFANAPSSAHDERDTYLAIRQGAGENVDELAVTRDLLHSVSFLDAWGRTQVHGPYREWAGVSNDEAKARAQLEAAGEIMRRLQLAKSQIGEA